jgi:nitroimidazol reductase NimA-like FMN-containing flavoprotein (pyridoxamine 5'-phosphate oxidase superfamily)
MAEDDATIEALSVSDCVSLLRDNNFGRVAFVVDDYPVVLPVNYRLAMLGGRRWVALRTRPGNVIDHPGMNVAFEVDGIDPVHRTGWSVLVRGTLDHVDPDAPAIREHFDSEPWLLTNREAWLIIEPVVITGRRLNPQTREWAFHMAAYL